MRRVGGEAWLGDPWSSECVRVSDRSMMERADDATFVFGHGAASMCRLRHQINIIIFLQNKNIVI